MKISSCIITKNEDENIGRCLESVKNISDEIIVVDTGSTDNTVEIAKSSGAEVYFYEWDKNFSNAKNHALDKATGDWIIFLDADEYFEINTQKVIKDALKSVHNSKSIKGVLCKMIHTDGYNGRVLYETPNLRIFRGNCGIRFEGAIHEEPRINHRPFKLTELHNSNLLIYHTGYALALVTEKNRRNLEILNRQVANNEITSLTYYYLSLTHHNLYNHEEAIKYALLALNEPSLEKTFVAYKPYVFLISSMIMLNNKYSPEYIQKYIDEAVSRFPDHPEIWYVKASAEKCRKDYPAAIDSYLKSLELNKNFKLLMHNNYPSMIENVYLSLAFLYKETGNVIKSLEYYFNALRINKYNFKAFAQLYDLIKDQPEAEILFFLNGIYDRTNKDDLVFLNNAMDKVGNTVLENYYYNLHEKL